MIMSVVGSAVSLFWSLVMLFFFMYLFGLGFTQICASYMHSQANASGLDYKVKTDMQTHFGSVSRSILTLFKACTGGGDWETYYSVMEHTGFEGSFGFTAYICFMEIAVLNVLTALFVERAMKFAQPDADDVAREQRRKELQDNAGLFTLIRNADQNRDETITLQELTDALSTARTQSHFKLLGLDSDDAIKLWKMMAYANDAKAVNLLDFVQVYMRMRGTASGVDVQIVMFEMFVQKKKIREFHAVTMQKLDFLCAAVKELEAPHPKE